LDNRSQDKQDSVQSSNEPFDIANYLDTWAQADIGWQNGGLSMKIMQEGEWVTFHGIYTSAAPESRIAEIYVDINASEIHNNTATVQYEDDNWGNSGTLVVHFMEDAVTCTIRDVSFSPDSMFGIREGEYELIRHPNASEAMTYTMEEYYAIHPEERPAPTHDTSKASGILASLGMTEDEFKASCQRLFSDLVQIGSPDGTELHYIDLVEYPKNYIGHHFAIDNIRRGEMLALQWDHIDFDKGVVHIQSNTVKGDGEVVTKDPKSAAGTRDISIGSNIVIALKQAHNHYKLNKLAMGAAFTDSNLVVCQTDGKPYQPDSLTQKWDRFMKNHGLKHIRLHDQRHSCTTMMIEAGIDPKTVQTRIGHADVTTTMNIYTHCTKTMDQSAADKIDTLLFA